VVDFSIPLYEDSTCILTTTSSSKGAENRLTALFGPFELNIWLLIIGLTFVYATLFYLIHHFITKKNETFMNSFIVRSNETESHTTSWRTYLFFVFGKLLMEGKQNKFLLTINLNILF
jgi:hypothetical protein